MANMRGDVQIVWFKHDLRVHDHAALAEAARLGTVVPLYIVEPELWRQRDASGRHWDFARECLVQLDAELGRLGSRLIVRIGEAVQILEDLRQRVGIAQLWSHQETGNAWTYARDLRVGAWARTHGIPWHEPRQHGVERRMATRDGWAARRNRMMAAPMIAAPDALAPVGGVTTERLPLAGELGVAERDAPLRQKGGRSQGLARLDSFLLGRGENYRRQMSNPLDGAEACSRLSPHLAFGTLSMREVAQTTWARRSEIANDPAPSARRLAASLRSFGGRLHWHCHFMQKLERAPSIEWTELHPSLKGLRPVEPDRTRLEAWSSGETGYPFLDASMRFLAATGWINFRMRAMLVSFASYNLWLPWQETGVHLARLFTDYEPGIHWPQMQMQSGTTGINTVRIYNVVKQGYDQDPQGTFVRRWVPELAAVPDAFVQEPWKWSGAREVVGRHYPERVVDLSLSTAEAKERVFAARTGPAFRAGADTIQERHGSRKSGLAPTGKKERSAGRAKRGSRQLAFDL